MNKPVAASDAVIDGEELRDRLIALAGKPGALSPKAREAILASLKTVMADGRAAAEAQLMADGKGTACAGRLSDLQDAIIVAIYGLAADHVYRTAKPSAAERMAVVAVGGYGRGTLAPGSDVDLLFLLPYKQTPWGESVVEFILYLLWDLGLTVGHATRSIDECIRLARSDMTIRTAVLEARFIWGDRALYDTLVTRFDAQVVKGTGPEFIAAKLAERDQRHRQQGATRYLVEPNVKEGKGGLRDLHTLFWIAKYFYRVRARDDLVKAGVFSRSELRLFRKAEDFLWAVRCHLHFMTGRAEERLSFDVQREMAQRLGYTSHPGLRDVERFMKHYFLVAKDVGDLTRIFCAALEEHHGKSPPVLNRLFGLPARRRRTIPGSTDFIVDNDRINTADEKVFERDPVNIIRLFHLADRYDLAFHPDAMQQVSRSLRLIDASLREDEEANRLFVEILTSRRNPEAVLRRMNETGVLGKFVPDFGKIVAMMQFNMYHHYTVDEHLIQSIGVLAEIERGDLAEAHPLANEIMPGIQDRTVLYVAMLVHDIAKGRPEDHSIAGARVARRLCPRLGLDKSQTETVAWLVEQHLTMSITAQSRDLNDRKTILDFAAVVQSLERLKMLLVLTVADIKAVGPGVWNGWKGQLLRTLYYETEPVLTGGHSQVSRDKRVAAAREELAEALPDWPAKDRAAYLAPALPGILAARRPAPQARPCGIHPRRRQGPPHPGHHDRAACLRGHHRDHRARPRSPAPAVDHRRRVHGGGRRYRRCPDLHHDRRPCSRFHLHQPRIRRRGRRTAPRPPHRRPDRAGAVGRRAHAGDAGAQDAAPAAPRRFLAGDLDPHRQFLVEPIHRHRSLGPRSTRPSLRPDAGDLGSQPQHRLGACRHLRRARRRRLLCDRSRRSQDHQCEPRGGHPSAAARRFRWRGGQAEPPRAKKRETA